MSNVAWLHKKLESGKILCQACAHACKLDEGEVGICGIRRVEEGELKLLVYGRVAALNIDPVEKKPLFHFLPNSKVFSLGTVGCNFSCRFCQNHTISQYPKEHEGKIKGDFLSPARAVALALEHNCDAIAYTYNEPVTFFEYSYDIAKLADENGLKNIYVTSGYETKKAIDTILPYIDGMNIDIKSFSDIFYKKIVGARLKPVLECVKYAYAKNIWIEITTLLIPDENDSDEEIRAIARFIADIDSAIVWHISAFHPMYKMLDKPRTQPSMLIRAYEIAKEEGLKYVYIGNMDAPKYLSTYCPSCKNKLISRKGHLGDSVTNILKSDGLCPDCGYRVEGVWS